MWILDFVPRADAAPLTYEVEGEILTVNGRAHDLAQLEEGGILPIEAIEGADAWLRAPVTRWEGVLRLCLVMPFPSAEALPDHERHPEALHLIADGLVPLPVYGTLGAPVERPAPAGTAAIDWAQVSTPELRELLEERAQMRCSPLQGRLVLGEAVCSLIDALAASPETPWAMRETILRASVWERTSQAMDELAYLLGYTDEQMDVLFRIAMTVRV